MRTRSIALLIINILLASVSAYSQPAVTLTVQADKPGARISPTMWGVFFEDINFGADGGLYAELVKNRSFEFPDPLMGWSKGQSAPTNAVSILSSDPVSSANRHYLRLTADQSNPIVVTNEGFRGMGVRAGEKYRFTVFARRVTDTRPAIRVELASANGNVLAQTRLKNFGPNWAEASATLESRATDPKAHLQLVLEPGGAIDLDVVSLFPEQTWHRRPNGLRADLVQMLADLKPGFVRFPGGCIVEGRRLETRYQWKTTIGKPDDRQVLINRWNDEFQHRPTPDYFQSFGLGFFEFFQLCEDIGAEPLPILNCGMACQFNSGELVPLDQLEPYIRDALDLIEFANGPPASPWGQKRAAIGHRRPFNLKFLGVGNEQWGPQYIERYARFARALKTRHPDIQLVSSAGPGPADENFRFAWPQLRELKADIVDEHCYARPDWFLDNTHRYDGYDRSGPKVFMGEYAAQSVKTVSPDNRNNWECALAEAAYMIGLERNADVVVMASYAPLFSHADAWQWTPDLIWCDNLRVFGTPSYYVQQLFSRNRGDVLLPVQIAGTPLAENGQARLYASACRETRSNETILKVVNATLNPVKAHLNLSGVSRVSPRAKVTLLAGPSLHSENSFQEPRAVAPADMVLVGVNSEFDYSFAPASVTVLRIESR